MTGSEDQQSTRAYLSPQSADYGLIALGRWVSTYNVDHGVIKRPITPRYGNTLDMDKALTLEPLLQQISGLQELNNLILLVAPSSLKTDFQRKLHCFERLTHRHLGSACITAREMHLMRKYQMLFKYELVYTDQFLSIQTVGCDSDLVSELLQEIKDAALPHIKSKLTLTVKSLLPPKIPVRLRVSDVRYIKRKQLEAEGFPVIGEPVWRL